MVEQCDQLLDILFFFRKRKSTKKKIRALVTRYNVSNLTIPVLSARYTMSPLFGGISFVSIVGTFF